jgi:protein-S-isoprenylcysteine O-methyltransferase Ste14
MPGASRIRARQLRGNSVALCLVKTLLQTIAFWGVFLFAIPAGLTALEHAIGWSDHRFDSATARGIGIALFAMAGSMGLASGITMAVAGRGTPLPFDCPARLVVSGPYRFIRNPMVVAGLAQGLAVGLYLGSWPVMAYALCGAPVWNWFVRPWEERDLAARLGEPYELYRRNVPCWIPRVKPWRAEPT